MKVGLYVRVSTLEQAEHGYSIDEQIEKLKSYCTAKDWQIGRVYADKGYSGATLDRPALQELFNDVADSKLDTVLVYKLDRLSRSQKDTLHIIEDKFTDSGVNFVSMQENFDTGTPFGNAMIGILAVFAQLEREQIRERMTMGKLGRAKSGKAMSWSREPFGYRYIDDSYEIIPLEATIVEQMFNDYANGLSVTKLVDKLNDDGHIGKNVPWTYRTVRNVLDNPVYFGYNQYNDEIYKGNHEPIITKELFLKVKKDIEIRSRQAMDKYNPRPFASKYMLSGLLYCGYCENILGYMKSGNQKKYKCRGQMSKKHNSIRAKYTNYCPECPLELKFMRELEQRILTEIDKLRVNKKRLEASKLPNNDTKQNDIKEAIKELENKRIKLADLYVDGLFTKDELTDKVKTLGKQIEGLNKMMKELDNQSNEEQIEALDNLDTSVFELSYEAQKALCDLLIGRINVKNDELEIVWNL